MHTFKFEVDNKLELQIQMISLMGICLYQFDVNLLDNTASTGVSVNAQIYFLKNQYQCAVKDIRQVSSVYTKREYCSL